MFTPKLREGSISWPQDSNWCTSYLPRGIRGWDPSATAAALIKLHIPLAPVFRHLKAESHSLCSTLESCAQFPHQVTNCSSHLPSNYRLPYAYTCIHLFIYTESVYRIFSESVSHPSAAVAFSLHMHRTCLYLIGFEDYLFFYFSI